MPSDHDAALRTGLGRVLAQALHDVHHHPVDDQGNVRLPMLVASDAALTYLAEAGVLIPPIPEGWELFAINEHGDDYDACIVTVNKPHRMVSAIAPTWQEALAAAIADALGETTP